MLFDISEYMDTSYNFLFSPSTHYVFWVIQVDIFSSISGIVFKDNFSPDDENKQYS